MPATKASLKRLLFAYLWLAFLLPACSQEHRDFKLSVTVDFFGDTSQGLYTHKTIDLMMREISDLGATRVYWLYYGGVDQREYGAGTNIFSADASRFGVRTLKALGEPLAAAVAAAHDNDLEIYGVLKPYHMGISATYPEGSPAPDLDSPLGRIGGTVQFYIPFMARYPHMRIRRRPAAGDQRLHSLPVRRIRLVKKDDSPTRIGADDLELWTSDDNYRYKQSGIDFTVEETIETAPADVHDYYGNLVTKAGDRVRVLTLDGLEIHDPFVVVVTNFAEGAPDFENTAVAMIEALSDGDGELPIVVATQAATWIRPWDYRTYGLEFDSGYGHRTMFLDQSSLSVGGAGRQAGAWLQHRSELGTGRGGGFIAFARGTNEYLPAAPCEAYPEVRRQWLWWIDRMLDKGVDGVVLRVSAHGTLTDEPYAYGFNEPVVAAYRKRYGADPLAGEYDPRLYAELHGEYYTEFVREASRRTRARGREFMVVLHAEAFRPNPVFGQIMGFPANIEFQWRTWLHEDLLDAVILRAAWYEAAEDPVDGSPPDRSRLETVMSDPVVVDMIDAATTAGLPVYMNRYVSRAIPIDNYVNDIETLYDDDRIAGFDIYEFFHLARALPDGSALVPVSDRIEKIAATADKLGL